MTEADSSLCYAKGYLNNLLHFYLSKIFEYLETSAIFEAFIFFYSRGHTVHITGNFILKEELFDLLYAGMLYWAFDVDYFVTKSVLHIHCAFKLFYYMERILLLSSENQSFLPV